MSFKTALIVATSLDRIIGINNRMPWFCKNEMMLMRKIVTGQIEWIDGSLKPTDVDQARTTTIIMGRKTFDGLKTRKPTLYGCKTIVVSKNAQYLPKDIIVAESVDDAMLKCGSGSVFFFGGQSIYKTVLDQAICSTLYVSRMKFCVKPPAALLRSSDLAYFPVIDDSIYKLRGVPINNNQFSLQVYTWSSEYCQALLFEAKKKLINN